MKKNIKYFLLLLIVVLLLVSCNKEATKENGKEDTNVETQVVEEEVKEEELEEEAFDTVKLNFTPIEISDTRTLKATRIPLNKQLITNNDAKFASAIKHKDNLYIVFENTIMAFKFEGDKLKLDEDMFDKGILNSPIESDGLPAGIQNICMPPNSDTLYVKSTVSLYEINNGDFIEEPYRFKNGKLTFINDADHAINMYSTDPCLYTKNGDEWELTGEKTDAEIQEITGFKTRNRAIGENGNILIQGSADDNSPMILFDSEFNIITKYDNSDPEVAKTFTYSRPIIDFSINKNKELLMITADDNTARIFKEDGLQLKNFYIEDMVGVEGHENVFLPYHIIRLDDNSILLTGRVRIDDGKDHEIRTYEIIMVKVEGF